MLYYKNAELASTYHVSVRTVRNWIESARQGKNDLTLHEHAGRHYVSNTSGNLALIEKLVAQGKKYRPHHTVKTVTPKPEFYKLFNDSQIYDIVFSLEIHHEIPRQYNYFDKGAHHWDAYAEKMASDESPNGMNGTIKLLSDNISFIERLTKSYKKVNIVDIGVGNALPSKGIIQHLVSQGKMGRYIAIDISPEMLKIANRNILKWFSGVVRPELYELDLNYERFLNVLAEEYIREDQEVVANIILLFGGTFPNFRDPDGAYRTLHESMGVKDYLFTVLKLDDTANRQHFDFNEAKEEEAGLPLIHGLVSDLLNIDRSLYDIELGYDEKNRERFEKICLKMPLLIDFRFEGGGQRSVEFNKGDSILVWRYRQQDFMDIMDQFTRNGFNIIHSSQTEDQEYMLTVSQVKHS